MATMTLITVDGDVLDGLIWRQLGQCDNSLLQTVYMLNPGLCDHGAILPAGLTVILPDETPVADRPVNEGLKLWD